MGRLQLTGRIREALRTLVPAALKISQPYGGDFEPLEREGLCVRCHKDWPEYPDFVSQWNALLERNAWATVFATPIWQRAVVDDFVPRGQFRPITVHRGGELLAIVPLALNSASNLENPGKWVTDYLDPLIDGDSATECWPLILELLEQLWDWSMGGLVLHHIRGDSQTRRILPSIARGQGWVYDEAVTSIAPYINLPKTWEEYLVPLGSHEAKNLKRKIRNAQTKGKCQWLTLTREEELMTALERALSHMRQADICKAIFTHEILAGFLRRLIPELRAGGKSSSTNCGWKPRRAWLLGLRSPLGPMMYNTAFDLNMSQWSPGHVAFALAIQEAIGAGYPIFNFLRGGEGYKKKMGAVDVELFRITVRPT